MALPDALQSALQDALNEMLQKPDVVQMLAAQGATPDDAVSATVSNPATGQSTIPL